MGRLGVCKPCHMSFDSISSLGSLDFGLWLKTILIIIIITIIIISVHKAVPDDGDLRRGHKFDDIISRLDSATRQIRCNMHFKGSSKLLGLIT